jgi:hypothetical protein
VYVRTGRQFAANAGFAASAAPATKAPPSKTATVEAHARRRALDLISASHPGRLIADQQCSRRPNAVLRPRFPIRVSRRAEAGSRSDPDNANASLLKIRDALPAVLLIIARAKRLLREELVSIVEDYGAIAKRLRELRADAPKGAEEITHLERWRDLARETARAYVEDRRRQNRRRPMLPQPTD